MIIGKMFGSDKGNRDDFAIWHTCAHVGLVIKIGRGRINQDKCCDYPCGVQENSLADMF